MVVDIARSNWVRRSVPRPRNLTSSPVQTKWEQTVKCKMLATDLRHSQQHQQDQQHQHEYENNLIHSKLFNPVHSASLPPPPPPEGSSLILSSLDQEHLEEEDTTATGIVNLKQEEQVREKRFRDRPSVFTYGNIPFGSKLHTCMQSTSSGFDFQVLCVRTHTLGYSS